MNSSNGNRKVGQTARAFNVNVSNVFLHHDAVFKVRKKKNVLQRLRENPTFLCFLPKKLSINFSSQRGVLLRSASQNTDLNFFESASGYH